MSLILLENSPEKSSKNHVSLSSSNLIWDPTSWDVVENTTSVIKILSIRWYESDLLAKFTFSYLFITLQRSSFMPPAKRYIGTMEDRI